MPEANFQGLSLNSRRVRFLMATLTLRLMISLLPGTAVIKAASIFRFLGHILCLLEVKREDVIWSFKDRLGKVSPKERMA